MNTLAKKLVLLTLVLALVLGAAALLMPTDTYAKGKPPKPSQCPWCPETIMIGGVVCTLEACGSDCVYSCPFPGP